jgi:two-component system, OmpR family, KDP operon response regulator KdpE
MLPTALIIDDNAVMREFIRATLEADGWEVREAADAASALRLFRHQLPQLVTLDLVMPSLDGLDAMDFLTLIRKDAHKVPVIVVSGIGSRFVEEYTEFCDLEVFDKSSNDPGLKKLFARANVIFQELSAK